MRGFGKEINMKTNITMMEKHSKTTKRAGHEINAETMNITTRGYSSRPACWLITANAA
jgi:hypothetical protein